MACPTWGEVGLIVEGTRQINWLTLHVTSSWSPDLLALDTFLAPYVTSVRCCQPGRNSLGQAHWASVSWCQHLPPLQRATLHSIIGRKHPLPQPPGSPGPSFLSQVSQEGIRAQLTSLHWAASCLAIDKEGCMKNLQIEPTSEESAHLESRRGTLLLNKHASTEQGKNSGHIKSMLVGCSEMWPNSSQMTASTTWEATWFWSWGGFHLKVTASKRFADVFCVCSGSDLPRLQMLRQKHQ